jgi:putative ABC transport system permease protein
MTKFNYILKSFFHYLKANLLVALGVAISTMVLTGSLIIGDSVRHSLEQTTFFRLGETTHLVAVTERYFRHEMATEMETTNPEIQAAPILLLEGVAVADGGQNRVNRVQVVGVDTNFEKIAQTGIFSELEGNEIIISTNLAERLEVGEGDNILVRVKKASLIPMNAPFVSAEETSVSLRAAIKKVVDKEEMGRFSLKTSQTAPYNIFISLDRLNRLMEFEGKANHILVSASLSAEEVKKSVENSLTPIDAGLKMKHIDATGELEISTERVFMEPKVAQILEQLPGAKPMITYFVNGIQKEVGSWKSEVGSWKSEVGSRMVNDDIRKNQSQSISNNPQQSQLISTNLNQSPSIPYSFVSSLEGAQLADNEMILTQWAADDLNAKPGDTISLKYLEIGPLRQLIEREDEFILKGNCSHEQCMGRFHPDAMAARTLGCRPLPRVGCRCAH